jgi:D-glycero-beta-D-manno-heptose 1-phosphate adenylyltransferase
MEKNWEKQSQKKLISPQNLEEAVETIRFQKKTIATINGSFDLLHAGHLQIIYEASKQADVLIIALNSDESIKRYKGEKRPIVQLKQRLQMMSALSFVSFVTFFDEDDPRKILSIIKPDVHINGSEYGRDCIEADVVENNGGRIHIVEKISDLSTSNIIEKIKDASN